VYSLIALHLEGMAADHPVMRRGLAGLQRFAAEDDKGWRLQACMSPVWDTALAVLALRRAGMPADAEPVRRAVDWLLAEQVFGDGDWQVRCPPGVGGGGWAFEFDNDVYPDVDDTTIVVLALLTAEQTPRIRTAIDHARRWVMTMRSSNGAWAAFDRDNVRALVYRLPFADFGAMLDPPSEDVTAHAVEMLGALGEHPASPVLAPAIEYLRAAQHAGGSWFGRWGVNHLYGTWCVVTALAPLHVADREVTWALTWTQRAQNRDGGWGETCHSYRDDSFAGVGDSTASQTAWAMLALQAGGEADGAACGAGMRFLADRHVDGTWIEPQHTGTGFPGDFYINYHLYRHVFPLMALAPYAAAEA
jgi:squalene-hopene/tetraprenyl-beta-curcumene cyclase